MDYCCDQIKKKVEFKCEEHPDPFECADSVIYYSEKLDVYGLIIHDGGNSFITIEHCPFCGKNLEKRR